MKWSSPHFDYKGMFCGIAAFKEHVGVWILEGGAAEGAPARARRLSAAGQFGRITSIEDLPSDKELARILKIAKQLNDDEVKAPPMRKGTASGVEGAGRFAGGAREEQEGEGDVRRFPSRPATRIHRVGD